MVINLKVDSDVAAGRLLPAKIKKEEELYKQRMLDKEKAKPKGSGENENNENDDDDSEKDEFPEDPEEFFSEELNEE